MENSTERKWKGTTILFESEQRMSDKSHEIRVDNQKIALFNKADDANLFADALNSVQKCDLMPSELLRQRDELAKLLSGITGNIVAMQHVSDEWQEKAQELIQKIKGHE